jgi:hypothetical protein
MKAVEQAKKVFSKYENSQDIKEIVKGINEIVPIYEAHKKEVDSKIQKKDFRDVEGVDFNEWAHDQIDTISNFYHELNSILGNLQFQRDGFSVVNVG